MSQRKQHRVVLFLENNARIITTDNLKPYLGIPGIAIDPDLSGVSGHPPHYWRLLKGKVVPVTNEEKIRRDALHKQIKWDHEELEKLFMKAKNELRMRQFVYGVAAAAVLTAPVGVYWMFH